MSNTIWTRRDPFADFDALVRNAFGPVTTTRPAGFTPAAEVFRDGDDAVVRLELPGVDVDNDVTVEVDGGRLTVRGERRDERAEQRDGRSLREVRYGTFRRSFGLPQHTTSEAVSATYDAGVLSVRVTGAYAGREARRIPVTAGATAVTAAPAVEAAPAERA
ncbi:MULTISPECIES: Hsp20/alpha crystallin family protein [Catenuloplanes]|uniref:HSP20 family molecular chaperone IbpA n=1 Tax=Catenuloplanes niger TaxID=587534 RepID=A0AAE3ZYZ3_9ACTN|nr:Hsp20/alpha crystallin family protein [Catenuloplanes niger]MDR7326618.1 HSP20 family molecular chaperone IbpA [Catenuloplanes niger]